MSHEIRSDKISSAKWNARLSQTLSLNQEKAGMLFFWHLSCLTIYRKELL